MCLVIADVSGKGVPAALFMKRLVDALNDANAESFDELLDEVSAAIDKFVGETPQFDDLTALGFALK